MDGQYPVGIDMRQAAIIAEMAVTGADAALLSQQIGVIWASYADRDSISPFLTDLYVRRRCAQLLMSSVRGQVDFKPGNQEFKYGQLVPALRGIIADATAEITRIETKAARSRGGLVTPIVQTAPVLPPNCAVIDANDPAITGGSPYSRDARGTDTTTEHIPFSDD